MTLLARAKARSFPVFPSYWTSARLPRVHSNFAVAIFLASFHLHVCPSSVYIVRSEYLPSSCLTHCHHLHRHTFISDQSSPPTQAFGEVLRLGTLASAKGFYQQMTINPSVIVFKRSNPQANGEANVDLITLAIA